MTDIADRHRKAKDLFFQQLLILWQDHEWNKELLKSLEKKCDFLPNYHLVLFPEGDEQIMDNFEQWLDQKMLDMLNSIEVPSKVREKIAKALEIRIIEMLPKSIILKQNAWFILPQNLLLAGKCYSRTCDKIWRYAGDKSDDFNYYTKRGLLLGVYASARVFYLSDDSSDYVKTKEFVTNSLDNIINVASAMKKIKFPNMEDLPLVRMFW